MTEIQIVGQTNVKGNGIPPSVCKGLMISVSGTSVSLNWQDPDNTVLNDQVLSTWAGTRIVKKLGSYPANEKDGTLVVDSKIRNQYESTAYVDTITAGEDWKYKAFPYSTNKVYCYNGMNEFDGEWCFSFKYIKSEKQPAKKIEYYGTNAQYTPAYMDFTSDVYRFNSWENAPFFLKDRLAPCTVYNTDAGSTLAGTVKAFLNPNDFTKNEDGTASGVADTSQPINAFRRIKLLYRRYRTDAQGNTLVDISNKQITTDFKPYGDFVKADGTLRDYIYLPIYKAGLVSSKARSMSGLTPMNGQTAANERTYCQNNGSGHDMVTYSAWELERDLFYLVHKTTDSQSALGQGKSNGGSSVSNCLQSGTMNTKGMNWGSSSTSVGVKWLYGENTWGSQWWRFLGYINDNGTIKIKRCQGTSDGSTVSDYNFTGSGYINVGVAAPSGTSGGYISATETKPEYSVAFIPTVASGSSSTYECDGMWYNNGQVDVAVRGGGSDSGALCGVSALNVNTVASAAIWGIGSSVSYLPL